MPGSMQAGDVLAARYRLEDLLAENGSGRFWRAHDLVLHRPVAVHVLTAGDPRAEPMLEAARRVGPMSNRHLLRILDAETTDELCYVVNEWGVGESLDILLSREGPLPPRRAAWIVGEVADSLADAHEQGLAHGRLIPENVLIDHHGQIRIIGFGVDAALHGLAPDRIRVDEIDLVALLYCALTGKWPGVSTSQVPPAPEVHGTVLRPRRVRAGIPRPLDQLCDQVLNPGRAHAEEVLPAREVRDLLESYVGDHTGGVPVVPPAPVSGRLPALAVPELVSEPVVPEPALPEPVLPEPAMPEPAVPPTPLADVPTQAGMPVFHDDDDEVEWLRARAERPAPPPPLTEPPPKPLFAPDPPEGQPVRRPRPGSRAASASADYWPWDSSQDSSVRLLDDPAPGETEDVPGRTWIRLAMAVAICLLVGVAAVAAYQLGLRPPTVNQTDDEPTTTTTPSLAAPTPFTGLTADDFDPQGAEPREENPAAVPNVLDGDPATAWTTATYKQNLGPTGLKTGVGLILDLGATKGVREIVVTTAGGRSSLAAYVTTKAPTGIAGLSPVGIASGTGELTITLDEAVSGRYVTVWFNLLPPVPGGFRGAISEVAVLG